MTAFCFKEFTGWRKSIVPVIPMLFAVLMMASSAGSIYLTYGEMLTAGLLILFFGSFLHVFQDNELFKNMEVIVTLPISVKDVVTSKLYYLSAIYIPQIVLTVVAGAIIYRRNQLSIHLSLRDLAVFLSMGFILCGFGMGIGKWIVVSMNRGRWFILLLQAVITLGYIIILKINTIIFIIMIISCLTLFAVLWKKEISDVSREKMVNRSISL